MVWLKVVQTWVKAPPLRGAKVLLSAECVKNLYQDIFSQLSEGRTALTCCPEADGHTPLVGKLASMIRCSRPSELLVVSVEGSPHCLLLHSAANEAVFDADARELPVRHYVVLEGRLLEVSDEAVRVARYLHLVQKAVEECPELVEELRRYSLEQRWADGR